MYYVYNTASDRAFFMARKISEQTYPTVQEAVDATASMWRDKALADLQFSVDHDKAHGYDEEVELTQSIKDTIEGTYNWLKAGPHSDDLYFTLCAGENIITWPEPQVMTHESYWFAVDDGEDLVITADPNLERFNTD